MIETEVDAMLKYNFHINNIIKPVIEENEDTNFDDLAMIIAENDQDYPSKDLVIDLLTMGYIQKNEYDLLLGKVENYLKLKGESSE